MRVSCALFIEISSIPPDHSLQTTHLCHLEIYGEIYGEICGEIYGEIIKRYSGQASVHFVVVP